MAAVPPYPPADLLKKMDGEIGIVRLITGRTGEGDNFYAYVAVRPSMYDQFERQMAAGATMNIDSFGKVLHKGFGTEPSEDVKRYMEEQYGIDPNFAANVVEEMKAELRRRETEKK